MARRFVPILFFVLSGCIIAVAFWVLLGDLQPAKPPKPMLVFTPETVHFGTVPQGVEHGTALLANVSTKPKDKQQISLTSTEGNFVTIRDIIVHYPAFSTVVAPDMQSATIAFDPDKLTDGTRYMQIRVVTTSENQPIFLLPINIHVVRGH